MTGNQPIVSSQLSAKLPLTITVLAINKTYDQEKQLKSFKCPGPINYKQVPIKTSTQLNMILPHMTYNKALDYQVATIQFHS